MSAIRCVGPHHDSCPETRTPSKSATVARTSAQWCRPGATRHPAHSPGAMSTTCLSPSARCPTLTDQRLPPPRDLPAEGARAPPTGTLERSGDCRFCDRPPVCPKRRPIDAQAQPPRETLVGVTLESLSLLGTGRPKIRTCPQLLGGYPRVVQGGAQHDSRAVPQEHPRDRMRTNIR